MKHSVSNIRGHSPHPLGAGRRGMKRRCLRHVELVHAWKWNTPSCGCNNFKAGGKFVKNLPVGGELVVPWEKSPPAVLIILGTILRDSFARIEQSQQEGLSGMTKVQDWSVTFLLLRLPMVHGWVIRAEGIVQNISIGEQIYKKKIVSEMAVFAKASAVRENSIQPLKIVVIFSSDRI